jgi:hypothetical protein
MLTFGSRRPGSPSVAERPLPRHRGLGRTLGGHLTSRPTAFKPPAVDEITPAADALRDSRSHRPVYRYINRGGG